MVVILSGVAGSRSEPATQSKDPGDACSDADVGRSSHDAANWRVGMPEDGTGPSSMREVLRLRLDFALFSAKSNPRSG